MRKLTIPQNIYQAMLAHARQEYPREACGLLRGRGRKVKEFLPAQNVAANPLTDYQVDSATLLQALEWEDIGDELIAIFHSHPHSPPYPSATDAAQAFYPDSVYLILSLQKREEPQMAGFFLRPGPNIPQGTGEELRRELNFIQARPGLFSAYLPYPPPNSPQLSIPNSQQVAFYLIIEENDNNAWNMKSIGIWPVKLSITKP